MDPDQLSTPAYEALIAVKTDRLAGPYVSNFDKIGLNDLHSEGLVHDPVEIDGIWEADLTDKGIITARGMGLHL